MTDVSQPGQAGTLQITPAMVDAGVFALTYFYDHEEDGLENSRATVVGILRAVFDGHNHLVDCSRSIPSELS